MKLCPYKERKPADTINYIQNTLNQHEISTYQTNWISNLNKFYSCSIKLCGTEIQSQGKGLSSEYCMASGYGEFMERLQNMLLFNGVPFDPESKEKYGFKLFIDEDKRKIEFVKDLPASFSQGIGMLNGADIYSVFQQMKERFGNEEMMMLPYYSFFQDEMVLLPYDFLLQFYGSNGMCAGNSHSESLVQGLCEIFERYVNRLLYFEKITPPTIPLEFIQENYPEEFKLIESIEKTGNCKVIAKDCSLGKGFPVIAIIYFDYRSNGVAIKFGAEPDTGIALQRCLTELLQGMDISMNYKRVDFSLSDHDFPKEYSNFRNIVCTGIGRMPNAFFHAEPSYPYQVRKKNFSSFDEKLGYMLDIVKKNGFSDVFIRDASLLGFPAHQIIIPGMSEIFRVDEKAQTTNILDKVESLSNIASLTESEILNLGNSLTASIVPDPRKANIKLSEWLKLPISHSDWEKITTELIQAMIHYRLGDYRKSADYLNVYIAYIEEFYDTDLSYYYCMKQFTTLLENHSQEEAERIIRENFREETALLVLEDLHNREDVFQYVPLPNSWDCPGCSLKEDCNYSVVRNTYLNLKKAQIENPINQENLRNILSGTRRSIS